MNMVRKVKVLSIKEPYATLICNKKKFIETRSYKTNYRGELYIHASVSKIDKETLGNKELMDIVDNDTFSYGKIICKCKLVDCIYMTSDYIKEIKKINKNILVDTMKLVDIVGYLKILNH